MRGESHRLFACGLCKVDPLPTTKLSPGELPCKGSFPSCWAELERWAPCRGRKACKAIEVISQTDFEVSPAFRAI